ncbi:hypothetical protein D3C73_1464160 [compost metagenome]
MVVQQQALGDGGEVGARLAQCVQFVPVPQHAHEGVLRKIGGIEAVTQLGAQPAVQPSVMGAIQHVDGVARGEHGIRHGRLPDSQLQQAQLKIHNYK